MRPPCPAANSGPLASAANEPRRWGVTGHADPVAAYAAPQLGMRPSTVAQLMKSINHRCAAIVAAFRALGDDVRLARFWEPLQRAYEGREALPLVPATWQIAQDADLREDSAELAYQLEPTAANLDRLIRAKEQEIVREQALLDSLRVERQRREGR